MLPCQHNLNIVLPSSAKPCSWRQANGYNMLPLGAIMKLEEVYQYYGSANQACKALGLSRQSFSVWNKRGYIPILQQLRLEKLTNGKLLADEKHAYRQEESTTIYLPCFRFYSKTHGLCMVETINFQIGKKPKIVYLVKGAKAKKLVSFSTKTLMQASGVTDIEGANVFEGDVVTASNHAGYFVFKHIGMLDQLKGLEHVKIVGHIYDGVEYGS